MKIEISEPRLNIAIDALIEATQHLVNNPNTQRLQLVRTINQVIATLAQARDKATRRKARRRRLLSEIQAERTKRTKPKQ
jgi:uncharacterized coiled-coil DUF342 family protein